MSPPHNGNQHLPFIDLIKLRKIDETTYQSIALPFAPGGRQRKGRDRSYGGHVYAQAAWAASQTVGKGLVIYVCTSLLSGHPCSQLSPALSVFCDSGDAVATNSVAARMLLEHFCSAVKSAYLSRIESKSYAMAAHLLQGWST